MSIFSIQLQKDVEHRITRSGIDLRLLDILVLHGDVLVTGKFIDRANHAPLSSFEIIRLKSSLFRIPGVQSVKMQFIDHPLFI